MSRKKTRQEFVDELKAMGRTDVILLGDYIDNKTKTLFKCTKEDCGHEWFVAPSVIKCAGHGCPVCAGQIVEPLINSIAVLRPDLVQYFENPDDAWYVSPNSHKKSNLKCPDCGERRKMITRDLSRRGFNCQVCGSKVSYPNRFIRALMKQLEDRLDYLQYEWYQKWTRGQLYDVYFKFKSREYVIEMQGGQHFTPVWNKDITAEELVEKDFQKANLAIEHGITPIAIDARESDADFIIKNIYDSLLSEIFDLSTIDWIKCKEDATKNIIKDICEYYNDTHDTITNISNKYKFERHAITRYLKIGSEFGWCDYTARMQPPSISKKINVFDEKYDLLYSYSSMKECARKLSEIYNNTFNATNISRACQSHKLYHNLIFEFA